MNELTLRFFELIDNSLETEALALVNAAPSGSERDSLMGYMYYFGLGGKMQSVKMAYVMFERAERESNSLALFMLGQMCDNGETPPRTAHGPRKVFVREDAPRLMERCVKDEGLFALGARLWLGEYYVDPSRGDNPRLGVDILEFAATNYDSEDAKAALVDYYRSMADDTSLSYTERTRAAFAGAQWKQLLDNIDDKEEL